MKRKLKFKPKLKHYIKEIREKYKGRSLIEEIAKAELRIGKIGDDIIKLKNDLENTEKGFEELEELCKKLNTKGGRKNDNWN